MWAQAVVVGVVAAAGWWAVDAALEVPVTDAARARTVAESMAVYRAAVVAYATAQPGFEGSVDDGLLSLPSWWNGHPGISAVVQGPWVAVYLNRPAPVDVLAQMQRLSAGSLLVGVAHSASGTLYAPLLGDTGLPVPAQVPDGAPVWLGVRGT
ncbi:type IV pilus biogenesis protein PilM [Roseateles sp. SL47]|uniref:type IV pilus biogenesis protein PilM n=1 Tax=Roseateles sp. SL47 TaxID=2995138 RepID=UPI00226E885B|nr:type IV pilus biogenesis protein PilM [Roseateles sp. SL47]WAC74563.1 type IV pilus biogenesis protein PilM [Roseateles sp. SL47]